MLSAIDGALEASWKGGRASKLRSATLLPKVLGPRSLSLGRCQNLRLVAGSRVLLVGGVLRAHFPQSGIASLSSPPRLRTAARKRFFVVSSSSYSSSQNLASS